MSPETFSQATEALRAGNFDQAEYLCKCILSQYPVSSETLRLLSTVYLDTQKYHFAVRSLEQLIATGDVEAQDFYDLGMALYRMGKPASAATYFAQAANCKPDCAQNLFMWGSSLRIAGHPQEAIKVLGKALQLDPELPEILLAMGNSLHDANFFEEAAKYFRTTITLHPHFKAARNNLALTLRELGQLEEALQQFDLVLTEKAQPEEHYNRATILLLSGNWREGFAEYEWRLQTNELLPLVSRRTQPMWDGSDPKGKRLLLIAEQGFGDSIQFVRYASMLKARGAKVLLECTTHLAALLATSGSISQIYILDLMPAGSSISLPLPKHDAFVPIMSLPHLLDSTENAMAEVPYLYAPEQPSVGIQDLLRTIDLDKQFKIGLVWSSKLKYLWDAKRNIPLEALEDLFALQGLSFYSLYKGSRSIELERYREKIVNAGSLCTDFGDTAHVATRMDLVISVDTAVAHLAGALGKATWVLLPYVPDWRWLLLGSESRWYPTMRLFRQKRPGEWSEVVAEVIEALATMANL